MDWRALCRHRTFTVNGKKWSSYLDAYNFAKFASLIRLQDDAIQMYFDRLND